MGASRREKQASSSPATGSVRTRCCRARCFAPARPQRRSPKRRARARRPTSVLHPEQPPSPCALRSRDAARRSSWSATSRTAARSRPRSAAALSRSSRPPAYASSSSEPLLVAPPPAQVPVEEVDPVRKRVGRRAARLDRPEERQRLLRLLDDLTDVREPLLFVDEIGEEHLQQSLVTRREPQRLPRRQPVAQRTPAGRGDAVLLPPTRPALLALDQTRTLEPLQLRIDLAVARAPEERGRALDGPLDVVARTLPEGDHPEHDLCRWTQLHISGRYISKMAAAVTVHDLSKRYGDHQAVRGVSFEIQTGEVFSLLGPNGAGKTTTVEILEGYRTRDTGTVTVLGADPAHTPRAWRGRIGVVLQSSAMYETLTVRESLQAFAGYYDRPRPVDEVVHVVGLEEKADARVSKLSGGQRRRLDFGLALVGDPELIFLDEPTTGFDPAARRTAWQTIRSLKQLGKTILLTTHYLDEAEQLSDRVAVLRQGQIVAEGAPAELTRTPATEIRWRENGQVRVERTTEPTRFLHELTSRAVAAGRELEGLEVRRPSLEDVYLQLTQEEER